MVNAGVIEGFYGRAWQHEERVALITTLAAKGFSHYCYAPKSDNLLRNNWQSLLPRHQAAQLQSLSQLCQSLAVDFEIGLSPVGILHNWNKQSRDALKAKLMQLQQCGIQSLALLFDDIPSDVPNMAAVQIEITAFVQTLLPHSQIIFCPSFYSFDPVLTEVFGEMPEGYWQTLGEGLNPEVEIFWTGDKVISQSYSAHSIAAISQHFKRIPAIWDNSLANDGRKTSPYLHCRPASVTRANLPEAISRISFNPMNQAAIAGQVLSGFFTGPQSYGALWQGLEPQLQNALNEHAEVLQYKALGELSAGEKQQLGQTFSQFSHPIASNIVQWLEGVYQFDPECLTWFQCKVLRATFLGGRA